MKKVSVIVPIYKVESYLDKCIESIAAQTYRDLEIILVDDGSPDHCPAMCDAWAAEDSRIKVIHKENGGLSDARNAGLSVATGALVSFIDSDDWAAPSFIQTLYDAMERTGAEVAECGAAFVDEDGTVLRLRQAEKPLELSPVEALRRLVLEDGVYQTVWNKLYRREICIPFETGKLNEDEFFTWKVFEKIEKLAVVETPLYNYLQRGGSIIGTGYHIRRLDGLVARFQRMSALQRYEELACLTRQQFAFDCLWHLQCVLRCLKGDELQQARRDILSMLGCTARVPQRKLRLNLKYRVWYELVQAMPEATAKIRNKLKIGL